jgi:hypothetical protein
MVLEVDFIDSLEVIHEVLNVILEAGEEFSDDVAFRADGFEKIEAFRDDQVCFHIDQMAVFLE